MFTHPKLPAKIIYKDYFGSNYRNAASSQALLLASQLFVILLEVADPAMLFRALWAEL